MIGQASRAWPGTSQAAGPRLLYLTHRVPHPPDKGDRIRTFHLLEWLSRRAEVHLACLADEPVAPETAAALGRLCERVAIVPVGTWARRLRALGSLALGRTATEGAFRVPALRAVLRGWARQTAFDVAVASASSLAPYLRLGELRGVPAVVDVMDVDSQKWLDYGASSRGGRSWLYRAEGRRVRRLERDLAGWARAVTLVSEAEADLYRRSCPAGSIHAIPNGVDLEYFRPWPTLEERGCVFVGALDYRPNVEGVAWFCRAVWPEIRRRRPDATLELVGRRPAPEVRALAEQPGIVLVGQVPDVRPHLAVAALAIVPLQIARGLQNKVLEAMAMGKAVVASPGSLVGLEVEHGVHALAASAPDEWARAVLHLLDDEGLRRRLGAEGRRHVEGRHRWEDCLEPFGPLLGLAAGPGRAPDARPSAASGDLDGKWPSKGS